MAVRALSDAPSAPGFDPDAELVEAARLDPRAFLALYDRYIDRVVGYVKLRVSDRDACEDVTSQVFTRALERIDQFNGRGTFAGWLFQIARNAVGDVHRERPRRQDRRSGFWTASAPNVSERSSSRWRPTSRICSPCGTAPGSTTRRSAL